MRLQTRDFEAVFKEKLSPWLKQKINDYNFTYRLLNKREKEEYRLKIIKKINKQKLTQAGPLRIKQWEAGWQENLNELSIIPHYFGKYPVIRFRQNLIKPLTKDFEYYSLAIITDWLFEKYFKNATAVYEFGCGTGHNLMRLKEINRQAELWGLDWAKSSQKIIKKLGLHAAGFDLFKPDRKFRLRPNSCILTVASLEQLGKRFKPIVRYWLKNQIKLCVNIEPVNELLDKDNQWDRLSIRYSRKRNYLEGYLIYLRQLEKQGKIEILQQQRTFIGSLLIDGYSVIVWSPRI